MNNPSHHNNNPNLIQPDRLLEARARRAAKFVDLVAVKSRNRFIDNLGGFQLRDRHSGMVIAGHRYELDADTVLVFCRQWPEERKFLNLSQWDTYHPSAPKISVSVDPVHLEMTKIEAAAMITLDRPDPLQLEIGQGPQPDPELELWYEIGFPNGRADLQITPRPPWILTFDEVYKEFEEFGYKSGRGVRGLAKRHKYPPEALLEDAITIKGCQLLKHKERARLRQLRDESEQQAKEKRIIGQARKIKAISKG